MTLNPPPSKPDFSFDDAPLTSPSPSPTLEPVASPTLSGGEEQPAPPPTQPEAPIPPDSAAPPRRDPYDDDHRRPPAIIDRIFEGRQTHILSGSSGAGKTSWLGWFMGQLMSGQPTILGHKCNKPPFAAYIASDRTIADALEKLGSSGWDNPPYYSLVNDHSPTADAYIHQLRGGAGAIKRSLSFFQYILKYLQEQYFPGESRIPTDSLLVIDGMAPFFGIEPAGSYLKVAGPLIELNRFCHFWKVNILLVSHASKQLGPDQRYTRVQDRILGSMALQGFTSTQVFLCEPELSSLPDAGLHELFWRSHSAPAETHEFRRRDDGLFDYVGLQWNTTPASSEPATTPVAAGAAAILAKMPEDVWTPAPAIQEQNPHVPKTTFYRWLDQLSNAGLVEREERTGHRGSKLIFVRRRKPESID